MWDGLSAALLSAGRSPGDVTSPLSDVIKSLTTTGRLSGEQAAWLTATAETCARVSNDGDLSVTGLGNMLVRVGAAQLSVLGQLMAVDPVEERRLLLEYYADETEDIEADLSAAGLALRLVSGANLETLPERHVPTAVLQQRRRLTTLRRQRAELDGGAACRPSPPTYHQLKQEVKNFLSSAGSLSALEACCSAVADALPEQTEDDGADRHPDTALQRLRSLLTTYSGFLAGLEARHGWYRDLTAPLLTAGRQVEFGLRTLLNRGERCLRAARLPTTLRPLQPILLGLVSWLRPVPIRLHCPRVAALIDTLRDDSKPQLAADWKIRVLMLICRELAAQLALTGDVSAAEVGALLREARLLWQAQQQRRREREQQQESIYATKTHCDVNDTDEEAETARQVAVMFPDYSDSYADLQPVGLEGPVPAARSETNAPCRDEPELTADHLADLWQLHRQAYGSCASARWLPDPPTDAPAADLIRPFCERYRLFSALCTSFAPQLDVEADGQLAPSHLVAAAVLEVGTAPEGAPLAPPPPLKPYDVYRDPHVAEVVSCRTVLQHLDDRCLELLRNWPDHPALMALRRCVGRVLQQPVTTPLVKVVTGLELVLERAQDWQQNAHRGVSLAAQLEEVTDLVLRWRKLELDCWKRCLDATAYNCHMSAARWLPHLLALLEDGEPSVTELTAPLQQFIESSPLGEFPARLQMLLSVHRQMVCNGAMDGHDGKRRLLCALLWNLYQYYSQFYGVVERHLRGLRKPIEQKVKDFVKIARWNDVNFWSVKDTVKKSHRMVHKHVKEFQVVLAQPVSAALLDPESIDDETPSDSVGDWDREQAAPPTVTVTPELFIARGKAAPAANPYPREQRLTQLRQLYLRSRRLCRALYTQSPLMDDIASLNDVTSCVCQTADQLSKLNVDGVQDKEKRRKQIGFQKQRKRQAVVELYRTLSRMGVSYRRGLATWSQESADLRLLLTPPVDVTGGDGRLSAAWRGCLKYECRAVSRLALLRRALIQPHRELGPQNLERMRGVSADLMTQLCAARLSLSELEGSVSKLSALLQEVSGLSCQPHLGAHSVAQRRYHRAEAHLLSVSGLYLDLLPRLRLYLLSAPDGQPTGAAGSLRLATGPESELRSRGRAAAEHGRLLSRLDAALAASRAARGRLRRAGARRWSSPLLWTRDDASRLDEARAELGQAVAAMTEMRTALGGSETDPVFTALFRAEQKLTETEDLGPMGDDRCDAGGSENAEQRLVAAARRLSGRVLLAVQRLFRTQEERQKQEEEQQQEEADTQVGLFSERIQRRLLQSAKQLDAVRVVRTLAGLVSQLTESPLDDQQSSRVISLLSQLLPLLNQYQHLCTFVLVHQMVAYRASAKLLSVLLKLFTVMSQKGFCTPEDLQEQDDTEAGTEFKELEDGGLGEGEGAKDVSDKLESEDQLEGAYKPGEEPEPADDDVKEEENGIEMSEDFGGRMQDVERKEDEDENDNSDDEDEEEPDKQMGDVDGENQERLDEKLWGSDDEDDEQPTPEDEEPQDGGHGREDAQLAAKEDDTPDDQADRKEQRQRQDVKENEMEEDEDQQSDPYHNNFPADAEAEELEMPERSGADSERGSESDSEAEEPEDNPWDIEQKADFPEDGDDKEQEHDKEQEPGEQHPDPDPEPEEASENEADKVDEQGEEQKGASDERADGDEPEPDEATETEQQEASQLDASEQAGEAAQEEAARGTQDKLQRPQQLAAEDRPDDQSASAERTDEKAAVGMAESNESGHQSADAAQLSRPEPSRHQKQERAQQRRPGQSDSKRSLGADNHSIEKRLKTVDADSAEDDAAPEEKGERGDEQKRSDLYQHIQDAEQEDALAADAATREQALERPVPADTGDDVPEPEAEDDVQMQEEEEEEDGKKKDEDQPDKLQPIRPEKLTERQRGGRQQEGCDEETTGGPERGEVDGQSVPTVTVQRPAENTAHTALEELEDMEAVVEPPPPDLEQLRRELESRLDLWERTDGDSEEMEAEAERAWQHYETVIGPLAQELCEQLRLILEPTQTAKLMGDYRTGKRLNMRKVIPYIASQFRKDKIWLRRTKPSKRDYQVAVAVDDSSSMSDSQSRQLAFEALALVSRALALLEVGQLAILSFGESTRILHGLHEPLGAAAGAQLLRRFTFAQTQTRVAAMLDSVTAMLSDSGGRRAAKLLLVVSDGRGIFHEGQETVRRAVRRARMAGIFLVLLIVDSPDSSSSVLDIRMPRFSPDGRLLGIWPYLDSFPFPFYVILRDIGALPAVLSDALRQWFELVTAVDR